MKNSRWIIMAAVSAALLLPTGPAVAKSLYVAANTNSSAAPIQAYNINPDGTLTFQATYNTNFGWGSVGLTIDTDSSYLFLTQESRGQFQLVDGVTLTGVQTITAPGASNLSGVVVDQDKKKVYAVDRNTNRLYVYLWDPSVPSLTLEGGTFKTLPGVNSAYGIALDEINDRLYVANYNTPAMPVFETTSWTQVDSIPVVSTTVSVAVDASNGYVYSSRWGSTGIQMFDLNTRTPTTSPTTFGMVGLAVDPSSGLLYATHGFSGDQLEAFDTSTIPFTSIDITGDIGDPTGIAIPGKDISFNPLNLQKSDVPDPVVSGANVTYTLCYDNIPNANDVNNVSIVDQLPAQTSFVSATGGGVYDGPSHTVTWIEGVVAAGSGPFCDDLVATVNAPPGSTITNSATIDSDDTPPTTRSQDTAVIGAQASCDTEPDGDVDIFDIRNIGGARGTINPLFDIDGDGVVTVYDARQCVLQCTNPRCAP